MGEVVNEKSKINYLHFILRGRIENHFFSLNKFHHAPRNNPKCTENRRNNCIYLGIVSPLVSSVLVLQRRLSFGSLKLIIFNAEYHPLRLALHCWELRLQCQVLIKIEAVAIFLIQQLQKIQNLIREKEFHWSFNYQIPYRQFAGTSHLRRNMLLY